MAIKRPNRDNDNEAAAAAMTNGADPLTTTTYMPRKSELQALDDLAHKTKISKSKLVRYALLKTYGFVQDDAITKMKKP